MAAEHGLLDAVLLNTEVDNKVVCNIVGSLDCKIRETGVSVQKSVTSMMSQSPVSTRITGLPSVAGSENAVGQHIQGRVETDVTGSGTSIFNQTLNGDNVNCQSKVSGVALAGTPLSSGPNVNITSNPAAAAPVVSNGPRMADGKTNVNVIPSSPNIVIRTPMNSQNTVHSPSLGSGSTSVTIRPPVQMGTSGAISNGSQVTTTTHIVTTSQGTLQSPLLQTVSRTMSPTAVMTPSVVSQSGIRTIAPQVFAPRMPQSGTNPPANVQNIQLPPGMVLVRNQNGQLLMIPQQTLAQMQAQAKSQSAMAPRPSTPTSSTPVKAPGTPIVARPVAPLTVNRQGSPTPSPAPATTTLQRPPVLQHPVSAAAGTTVTPSVGATVQQTTPQRIAATPNRTVVAQETMENVKKCKNFLSTLIKLACSGKQSTETAANVKDLVRKLLEGKIEPEDFTSRLYRELNSSPQPYLVPFLKRSLPALRQLTPDSAAFILQSQGLTPSPVTATTTILGPNATAVGTTASLAAPRPHLQPTTLVLRTPQPGSIRKPSQVSLATTPMVTLRAQPQNRVLVGPPSKLITAGTSKGRPGDSAGGTFKDDDDINDVASMAGVNLSEESARILATNSELVGTVMRSCKDEAFLHTAMLTRRMMEIGKKYGITELGPDVVTFVSHATQQRLTSLLEKVSAAAQHKNINLKEGDHYEQASDVRLQLKFFEQLDQLEKQRKEEQEREILMKAAKSRARQEDPEQLRLKQKAKEMQQQELAEIRQREANLTALAAIGPRKRKKMDSPGSAGAAEASSSASSGSGSSRQFTRQRITRINLRDLLFCLENEDSTSHSQLLYRALLK
ncbi:transcription initiation factor TFIID subunit 4-like isoform X2 [Alosa sapidissima]|uniref:transcription initiation factor TFIID subunit 4-like isoform X2 n=1 Tax=Alosa sapidissima TaxID=34773 RepID=UPI001C0A49A1|nr:transcription initiation factor TFIID subunit 4-like isoform X2 [Alosa sapidissima]